VEHKLLDVKNLQVIIDDKKIINDMNLTIEPGQFHAIMGPNGSGKSTFSYTLMGHPKYNVKKGRIIFDGQDITNLPVESRAKAGLFLAFQYPHEIEGLSLKSFLRQAYNALYKGTENELDFDEFEEYSASKANYLKIKPEFLNRSLNFGFSGGEKKKAEVLQLAVLQPKLAVLDEIDSGLDVDALRIVCESIKKVRQINPDMSLLIITHYPRILNFLEPDFVHVLKDGRIVESGDKNLATLIENEGYKE
jgi:Fe-S cluster assembly ATP-binding protein